jgi:hypothetical protein
VKSAKIHVGVWILSILLPFGLAAQQVHKLYIPKGWFQVRPGITRSPYGPVPSDLFDMLKGSGCKLVAYDAKAASESHPAIMCVLQIDFPSDMAGKILDADALNLIAQKSQEGLSKSMPGRLLENKVFPYAGTNILRAIEEKDIGKDRQKGRVLEYYFQDGNSCLILLFFTTVGDFSGYGPMFQSVVGKILASSAGQ